MGSAKLRTQTFRIPDPEMLTKPKVLFRDLVELEDAAIGSVMAGMHTFTREKRIDLLKANFQFATGIGTPFPREPRPRLPSAE